MKQIDSTLEIAISASLKAGKKIMEIYLSDDFEVTLKSDSSPLTKADQLSHHTIMEALSRTDFPILSEEGKSIPYSERKNWKTYWLIDPLDGTKEFIKRNGDFTVNIALISEGIPVMGVVYTPTEDMLFFASRGDGAYAVEKASEIDDFSENAERIKATIPKGKNIKIVSSRSHFNEETENFIKDLEENGYRYEKQSRGSSLKLCQVARGEAHVYPRFGPTMEWDTAAAHGICREAGAMVMDNTTGNEMSYNKEILLNNYFIVYPEGWEIP